MRFSRNPAFANNSRNSDSVRSIPPSVSISISISSILSAPIIIPVVNNVLHDVRIASRRRFLKEASTLNSDPGMRQRIRHYRGKIIKDTLHTRVVIENRREQKSMSASDVSQLANPTEVVSVDD